MRQTPSGSAELTPGKLIKLTKEQEIALRHWRDSNEGRRHLICRARLHSRPAGSRRRVFLSTWERTNRYFGRIVGSPPGLPGGGITGILPTSGVGMRITGSTPAGGHRTPSDLASLSPRSSLAGLVVLSRGSIVELPRPPWFGETCIGAQPADPPRGTLSCVAAGGGVIEDGGVCASAAPAAMKIVEIKSNARVCMENKRHRATVVPRRHGSSEE